MTDYRLYHWKPYLAKEDYAYLIQYVDNIWRGIPNDKMIILFGPGRSGKTTLKNDIVSYLGDNRCGEYAVSNDIIYSENIKPLVLFTGIHDQKNLKTITLIINLIKYKQSIISDTTRLHLVNPRLLEHSRVIRLIHVF